MLSTLQRHRIAPLAVFALLGCGSAQEDATSAVVPDTQPSVESTTTTSAPARWTSPDDLVGATPDDVLPSPDAFVASLNSANSELGGTDGIEHRERAVSVGTGFSESCASIGYGTSSHSSDLPLTEVPSVGILDLRLDVYVCDGDAEIAQQVNASAEIVAGGDRTCPVDRRTDEPSFIACVWTGDFIQTNTAVDDGRLLITGFAGVGTATDLDAAQAAIISILENTLDDLRTRIDG